VANEQGQHARKQLTEPKKGKRIMKLKSEHFHQSCSDEPKTTTSGLFGFWFRFGSVTGFCKPAPSPKPRQPPKILAAHRHIFSVNALAGGQVALAATVAAALTFASGCSSDKGGTGESYGYSTSTSASTTTTSGPGETKAVIPLYKESVDVGKKEVDAGTVRVKKVVKTDVVNTPVELRHEEIVIERQPASASDSAAPDSAFNGQETVIHLTKEEPIT
jgi:hypothetical protein